MRIDVPAQQSRAAMEVPAADQDGALCLTKRIEERTEIRFAIDEHAGAIGMDDAPAIDPCAK